MKLISNCSYSQGDGIECVLSSLAKSEKMNNTCVNEHFYDKHNAENRHYKHALIILYIVIAGIYNEPLKNNICQTYSTKYVIKFQQPPEVNKYFIEISYISYNGYNIWNNPIIRHCSPYVQLSLLYYNIDFAFDIKYSLADNHNNYHLKQKYLTGNINKKVESLLRKTVKIILLYLN